MPYDPLVSLAEQREATLILIERIRTAARDLHWVVEKSRISIAESREMLGSTPFDGGRIGTKRSQ
jgi:hypothetical protein